jgi:hypothetical protein
MRRYKLLLLHQSMEAMTPKNNIAVNMWHGAARMEGEVDMLGSQSDDPIFRS